MPSHDVVSSLQQQQGMGERRVVSPCGRAVDINEVLHRCRIRRDCSLRPVSRRAEIGRAVEQPHTTTTTTTTTSTHTVHGDRASHLGLYVTLSGTRNQVQSMPYEEPTFCSEKCRKTEMNRSVTECTVCGNRWGDRAGGPHYCNSAWKVCKTCANSKSLCVVCGMRLG